MKTAKINWRWSIGLIMGILLFFSGIWVPSIIYHLLLPEGWVSSGVWWAVPLIATLIIAFSMLIVGAIGLINHSYNKMLNLTNECYEDYH